MKTVDQILNKAAELIDAAPILAKGVFVILLDDKGQFAPLLGARCYCTIGAIDWVALPLRDDNNVFAIEYLADYIGLPVSNHPSAESAIYTWNDADERTKDEVVTALRGAAAQYRQENADA